MHVSPTTATRQRADGIVTIDYDICIGCAYCDVACPYQARFKIDAPHFAYGDSAMQNEIEREDSRRLGVAQKCTFCSDRIDFGIENGVTPGIDPRATPACVNACIATALHFGDIDDPDSNVSQLLREYKNFRMHEEVATEPGFYYLYDAADRAAHSGCAADTAAEADPVAGRVRARGVEPWHQQHWDWKAAGNFLFGGAGSGLYICTTAAALDGYPTAMLSLAALGIIAVGLLLLLFKIGRPLRFIYVLRQPQRSWMSREAWIVGAFFPVALLALWLQSNALFVVAMLLGLPFLFSQAMILKEAKGIPAWRAPLIVPLIVVTGLAEGAGLFLVATQGFAPLAPLAHGTAVALLMLVAVKTGIWRAYLNALIATGAPTRTVETLIYLRPWFFAFGLLIPALTAIAAFFFPPAAAPLFIVAGLLAFASGWAMKFILITRAGYNQGFALAHTPRRGAGAAGPPVKPGWTVSQAR
jgi:Fe-S-cluster-containing dehydrogenase component/DMSO reductase anchor subunit